MVLLSTLTLFPHYSLDTSILVAVLVGVVLLALLTETLGWVFVGLVVPGYLASIFVIHPEAGTVVLLEAVLTYLLALGLSRGMSRTGAWSDFFGRDRFFVIVLSSLLVRAVCEAWLLPHAGRWLDARLGTTFSLDRSLHSIGLVLVPLTANAFWKLKLRRGLLQVGVPVALTYALLRWVLLPGTNLTFSSLELIYEDIAQNFLASPKAYIILLTTALLAARFNLRYGWDFNGILVPALLALTWLEPSKLVATLVEVLVLVLGTRALLALPGLRTLNLEGPRKTVLVFFLGFVLKWSLGWAVGGRLPGLKVTDLFGFGYLVPTLLAVKILQKREMARVMLATVHTSLAGFLVGSLVGFGLSLVEPRAVVAATGDGQRQAPVPLLAREPLGVMALARATTREQGTEALPLQRRRGELRRYAALWRKVDVWLETGAPEHLGTVRKLATPLGLEVRRLPVAGPGGREAFVLAETRGLDGKVGWDTALLLPGAPGPVLEVPRPVSEAPGAEAAVRLCERVRCRAILVSGVDGHAAGSRQGDALLEERTPLGSAHAALEGRERIQVRADSSVSPGHPVLHVAEGAPASAEELWPGAERVTAPPPEPGVAWGDERLGVLRAHPEDLLAVVVEEPVEPGPTVAWEALPSVLSPSLAGSASAAPPPTNAELLVLQQQVVAPLLALADTQAGKSAGGESRLRWVRAMAALLELRLHPVEGCGPAGPCWLLVEPEEGRGRLGAGLLVRPEGAPVALEAPTPVREPGTLPVALELWRATGARALLFAAPAPALAPESPHPASPDLFQTAFQSIHEAIHRALPTDSGLILQLRGYADKPGLSSHVLVELEAPVLDVAQRPQYLERLLVPGAPLAWLAPMMRYHDGSPELVGLSATSPQQSFSRTFGGARLATLWLSEQLRGAYVAPRLADEQLALTHLAPPLPRAPLRELLGSGLHRPSGPIPPPLRERFAWLTSTAERLVLQQGIHDLRALTSRPHTRDVSHTARLHWSPAHGLPYLLLEARHGRRLLRAVYFLQQHPPPVPRMELVAGTPHLEEYVERALRQRTPVVLTGELPASEARP
jgi:hypothetical protein